MWIWLCHLITIGFWATCSFERSGPFPSVKVTSGSSLPPLANSHLNFFFLSVFINVDIFLPAMVPHSSALAWEIPWTEEPGRLQSMGSLRVRHDWVTSLSLFPFVHWRRKWQPTPVFLPGESQGRGSLVGCRLWGHTELDTTEAT